MPVLLFLALSFGIGLALAFLISRRANSKDRKKAFLALALVEAGIIGGLVVFAFVSLAANGLLPEEPGAKREVVLPIVSGAGSCATCCVLALLIWRSRNPENG